MFAALLFTSLALQGPALKVTSPILFRGSVSPGRCRVPLLLGDQMYLFLIDTGIDHSYIRFDVKHKLLIESPDEKLVFGSGSIPVKKMQAVDSTLYREIPPVAGIVGMDLLKHERFTIDYVGQTLTLWPTDKDLPEMSDSVGGDKDRIVTIDLIDEENTPSMFVNTSLGEAELDTGAMLSLLPKTASTSPEVLATKISQPLELFDGTAGRATQAFVRNLSIGSQQIFCQQVLLSDTVNVGVISPSLFAKRVLFDFPNKKIVFAEPDPSWMACKTIGTLVHGMVEERNGEPFLKAQLAKNMGPKSSPWVRIVSIDGHKGSDLLKMLKDKDSLAATIVQHAYDSLAKGGIVLIEHDGKQEKLYVQPFLR